MDTVTREIPVPREAFGRALLRWFDSSQRGLPWRHTKDPYAILVSEVMLQQTQAARVAEYWPRFLRRFPTVRRLASAPLDDVLAAWSGLGYYRRALLLHEAARTVVADRSGVIPSTSRELRLLRGVGEYTASAVASIAFGEVTPVLDANVARVLGRVLALRATPATSTGRRLLLGEAGRLIHQTRPGDWNQAMMELGAVVCLPAAPRCAECPVRRHCHGRRLGDPLLYPAPGRSDAPVALVDAVAVIARRGRVLLVRRDQARGWWRGLWVLPRCGPSGATDPAKPLTRHVRETLGLSCRFASPAATTRYSVTKHRVLMLAFRATRARGAVRAGSGAKWFGERELATAAVPSPDRRAIAAALAQAAADGRKAGGALRGREGRVILRGRTRR